MALAEFMLERFLAHEAKRGLAERTLEMRLYVLRSFAGFIDPAELPAARQDDIEQWLASRQLGAQGRYTYLMHLRSFYRWALLEELLETDPTRRIPNPRLPRRLPRPIADPDLRDALVQAGPVTRAWLYLAALQGLRCHEIAGLRRQDVLVHHDPPLLVVNGKGGRQRVLPLHPLVVEILPWSRGYLFMRDGHPYSARQVSTTLSQFFRRHSIDATAHQLRHWFGTKVYESSRDLRMTQELLGHASPATTAGYVAFSPGRAARIIAGLQP